MINLTRYAGTKTGIFGLGKTGLGAVKTLLAAGAIVYAWDNDKNKIIAAKNIIQSKNVFFSVLLL